MKRKREKLLERKARIQTELDNMNETRRRAYERITGVPAKRFLFLSENAVSITCESAQELQKVLANLKPFRNGWKIGHNDCKYITSEYRVDMKNEYNGVSFLQIRFESACGTRYYVVLNVCLLPRDITDVYFVKTDRKAYDSERHYFQLSDQAFRDLRISAVTFTDERAGWWGGDVTLIEEKVIHSLVNDILNIKFWEKVPQFFVPADLPPKT